MATEPALYLEPLPGYLLLCLKINFLSNYSTKEKVRCLFPKEISVACELHRFLKKNLENRNKLL